MGFQNLTAGFLPEKCRERNFLTACHLETGKHPAVSVCDSEGGFYFSFLLVLAYFNVAHFTSRGY